MVLRLPPREVTWAIPAYVITQCLFSLVAFLGLQKGSEFQTSYKVFFGVTFSACLLLSMFVMARLLCAYPFGLGVIVILGSLAISLAICAVTYYQLLKLYKSHVPIGYVPLCFQAVIQLTCGIATLLTVLEPATPSLHAVSLSLSLFWLSQGIFLVLYMLGYARTIGVKWNNLNQYVPPMLAAIAFGWLAFQLSNLQAESAQQAVVSDRVQVMEAQ
jgi:hypothetical protein